MNSIRHLLARIKTVGVKRTVAVKTTAMGKEREFFAYDIGADTFILEKGIASHLNERPSVLIVEKRELKRRAHGWVMTITTGNHSVAAFPLLDGRFWRLSRLPSAKRSEVLMRRIICANVVGNTIEISQREISTRGIVAGDEWLLNVAGLKLCDVVMNERNDVTLDYYRRLGQDWRVKPLAWTEAKMKVALAASQKRISSKLRYFHSAKGVHFLSFPEFRKFSELAELEPDEFIKGLRELVSVYEGNLQSFTRMPKHRGHHEIEFFGLRRGVALERLIPEIEKLMEAVVLGRMGQLGVIQRAQEIVATYESLLTRPEFADENSKEFTEALYMHITGEIYAVMGEGSTPAFDDRRTALPGATFENGRAILHIGADDRTEILLSNICDMMSKDEVVEYANVYELRTDDDDVCALGKGKTREIVYKTSRGPLEHSLVEKRLARAANGYGSYMLARVEAFKALGMALSEYRLLRRWGKHGKRPMDYYIRRRCEGEPMDAIPANYFCSADDSSVEEKEVVLGMATLMGDAAAQNMAMKKFDPATASPLYGIGKEIYEFEYDIIAQRVVPKSVSTCSMRGSFGWPSLEYTDENLQNIASVYLAHYAHALKAFQRRHSVPMLELAERFMSGFEFRTHAMSWQLSVMRDKFEAFDPPLPKSYGFAKKWRFVMWSLDRQERRLPILRKMFFKKVEVVESENQ
jgi:hypothetical protein